MKNVNITVPTDKSVQDFIAQLDDEQQRQDSERLVQIMHQISGEPAVMWGSSIVGFGKYHYKYASGREGDMMEIGFSPRKGKLSLYITGDAEKYTDRLDAIGKYKTGKGCIYINKLADVDVEKFAKLIADIYTESDHY